MSFTSKLMFMIRKKATGNITAYFLEKLSRAAVVMNDFVYFVQGKILLDMLTNLRCRFKSNFKNEFVLKTGEPLLAPVVQSEYADGSVTTAKLDSTILKYLKPEITSASASNLCWRWFCHFQQKASTSLTNEGWFGFVVKPMPSNITDANATLHDGNYSIVVSNDFGSEVDLTEVW